MRNAKKFLAVTTQGELDAVAGSGDIPVVYSGEFVVDGDWEVEVAEKGVIHAYGNALVWAYDGSIVHAHEESRVRAFDHATVYLYDDARVKVHDSATVYSSESLLGHIGIDEQKAARGTDSERGSTPRWSTTKARVSTQGRAAAP